MGTTLPPNGVFALFFEDKMRKDPANEDTSQKVVKLRLIISVYLFSPAFQNATQAQNFNIHENSLIFPAPIFTSCFLSQQT